MFENGRPRYWIGWYDRWHLALPLLLAGALVAVWRLPAPVTQSLPVARRGTMPVRVGGSTVPSPLPPMAPTTLLSPLNGKGFFQSRIPDAEGQAEPGSMVLLEYAGLDLVWHELSRMPADTTGRFQFHLRNFPPTSYRLRARAFASNGLSSASGEVMITVAADPSREPRRRRSRK